MAGLGWYPCSMLQPATRISPNTKNTMQYRTYIQQPLLTLGKGMNIMGVRKIARGGDLQIYFH